MTAVLNAAALVIPLIVGVAWLLLDRREQRRQRRWEQHTREALHLVSPNHPSVRRDAE